MQNIEEEIIKRLSAPMPTLRKKQLRTVICGFIKEILSSHAEHGDRKALHEYISSTKGYVIGMTTYDRILATETDLNQQADERTAFIVLRHAASFFGSDITLQLEELYRVLDSTILTIV